ncbi:MAG: heat-inducible transcription repressor HrcA [Clostridiales bacterium]|nr:heat-inducible transcription repressor HrcA [Clostridiales bacterium]
MTNENNRTVSGGSELSERKKLILKAIIDAHIYAGEPIGSKYLTKDGRINYSSATIRNEMAELEELGYLEQPHTSAGRSPSEAGYRFYVDSLMESYQLTSQELRQVNATLGDKLTELDRLLDSASRVMAALINYTTLAVKPRPKRVVIAAFRTVWLAEDRFMLLIIMTSNIVSTKHVRTSTQVTPEQLMLLEDVLNRYLTRVSMDEITLPVIVEAEAAAGIAAHLVSPVMKCVYEVVNEISGDLRFEGVNRLLQYPEYADIDRLRELLAVFERKEDIINVVSNSERDITNIYIGSENEVEMMHRSTLVFKTITSGGRVIGAIGVIGPCRMDYSRVVSTVEYLSGRIAEMTSGSIGSGSAGSGAGADPGVSISAGEDADTAITDDT